MRSFFKYYKWHMVFAVIAAVCVVFTIQKLSEKETADLRIGFASSTYMNTQYFNDNKQEIEMLLFDATGDGKRSARIKARSGDDESKVSADVIEFISSGEYDIIISSESALRGVQDKSVFVDASTYKSQLIHESSMLKDANGRAYAVSLEDNSLMQRLGATETDKLYIAALAIKNDKNSTFRKNGKNICGYIIENRDKYK